MAVKNIEVELTQKNPQLLEDVSLFKLILPPLQLYVLKYFIYNKRPVSVRETYTYAINSLWENLFNPGEWRPAFLEELKAAGYCFVIVNEKERRRAAQKICDGNKTIRRTELIKAKYKALQEVGAKVPSYDKLLAIFQRFERLGILKKIGKEGKAILYVLNPLFYIQFKSKFKKIIQL